MSEDDRIRIACPLCSRDHVYPLLIERSISLGMSTPSQGLPERRRSFLRLFTCPATSGQFEATLTLSETVLNRIEGLTVGESAE
jgi:hypothetical protein